MRLIDKYLLRLFLTPLFSCLFTFISIYIIIDLFGHLDEIIREQMGLGLLLVYYLSYIPSIIVQITPIALMIATMYTLGNLARHNEIIALRASGISVWGTLKPFIITGLFISFFMLILNDRVVPSSNQRFLKIKEWKFDKKKTADIPNSPLRNVAIYGADNKIIYARLYDPKIKILKDIVIHKHDRHQNIIEKTTAKEAKWTGKGWAAFNITTYKLDIEGQIKEEPVFKHRGMLDIRERPEEFQNQKYKTEVLNSSELKNYIKRLSGASGAVVQGLKVEAYSRFSYPFANIIAIIIGAAFCLKTKRGGRLTGIGLGFVIGFLFYGVFAVSIAMGKGGVIPPFLSAWLANIIFGTLGIYYINKY